MKKPQALFGLLAALGTAIGVIVAVVGLPYGQLNYTAFAGLYHYGGTPAANPGGNQTHIALDCDTGTAGIQDMCTTSFGPGHIDVDVILENGPAATNVAAFNFDVVALDETKIDPLAGVDANKNGNPDMNDPAFPGATWTCGLPAPSNHLAGDPYGPGTAASRLVCYDGAAGDETLLPPLTDLKLGTVHYSKTYLGPAAATVTLEFQNVSVGDAGGGEVGTCRPDGTNPMNCFSADINYAPAPPTLTPTATNTSAPTNTPTATATSAPFTGMEKVPEGNANNVNSTNPDLPLANLWLCVSPAPCSGPGEGSLHVTEKAAGVVTNPSTLGLGAYEFQVEYDNSVIQSVNPCDVVFSPGGAGAARGPVDQVDSSSPANPDCTPDPEAVNNGTCSMSLILENVIRFGCVTLGQTPGPTGSFDLASLELVPHPDLVNDIFPGNNNGVVTILKDNGCELADTLGHPIVGAINGGLTPTCGDLAVTVRILEGDVDLDCTVDVTDESTIALHYGGFFGSLLYTKWLDLEPALHDLDIDIKDIQKVFGRDGSTCQNPIPAQPPVNFQTGNP